MGALSMPVGQSPPSPLLKESAQTPPQRQRRGGLAFSYAFTIIMATLIIFARPPLTPLIIILLMFAYLGYGLEKSRKDGLILEFSDSFYYLGFTLTIIALLYSLDVFGLKGGKEFKPKEIMEAFGIALTTTVIGIIGRVTIQMFYRTPLENIEETNRQIEMFSKEYLSNLEQVNDRSRQILLTSLQELGNDLTQGLTEIRKTLNSFNRRLQDVVQRVNTLNVDTSGIESAFTTMTDVVNQSNEALKANLTNLQQAQSNLMSTTSTVKQAADSVNQEIRHELEQIHIVITSTATHIGKLNQVLMDEGQALSRDGLARFHNAVVSTAEQIQKINQVLSSGGVEQLGGAISSITAQLQGVDRILTQDGRVLNPDGLGLVQLKEEVGATRNHIHEINRALDEIVDAIRLRLDKIP